MKFKNRLKSLSFTQKVIGTIILLFIFKFLTHVPVAFINREYLQVLSSIESLSFLNMLTGGGFEQMSIMALGITPYITASIIIQLLAIVFPKIDELRKDGKVGQKKIEKITLILGIVLSFIQAFGMIFGYGRQGLLTEFTWYTVLIPVVMITIGATITILMGHFITEYLFGNGTSLILVVGILSEFVKGLITIFTVAKSGRSIPITIVICIGAALAICVLFGFVYYLIKSEKRIPITYNRRTQTGNTAQSTFPLKLLTNSVVPVIFASTLLTIPALIQSIMGKEIEWLKLFNTSYWFRGTPWYANFGIPIYCLLIIGFNYFSNTMNLNTVEIADNLKKNGGMIPGIRPGKPTQLYLDKQLKYMTLIGAIFLCIIALIPNIVASIFNINGLRFLGTSTILIVSIIIETKEAWLSERVGHRYTARSTVFGTRSTGQPRTSFLSK